MDRREFSTLLPMLFAAPALAATAEAQASGSPATAAPAPLASPACWAYQLAIAAA